MGRIVCHAVGLAEAALVRLLVNSLCPLHPGKPASERARPEVSFVPETDERLNIPCDVTDRYSGIPALRSASNKWSKSR
jgi:hypothetical protein